VYDMAEKKGFRFPLGVNEVGAIHATGGDERIRAKITQLLFTSPGERIHQPEFGCGLLNLVFEPNHSILAPAMQFTIGQALARWLSNEMITDAVQVTSEGESVVVEIVYTKKQDLKQHAVRIQFK